MRAAKFARMGKVGTKSAALERSIRLHERPARMGRVVIASRSFVFAAAESSGPE